MSATSTPADPDKTILIHAGTHKTATTSLQAAFVAFHSELASAGTLYPTTGRIGNGHHNIAWGLVGDRRFASENGYLAELAEEIMDAGSPRVLLSSEDFEYLCADESRIRDLRCWTAQIGYQPLIVFVLREVAGYVESLYAELVQHGMTLDFDVFARTALAERGFFGKAPWTFSFDYGSLASPFVREFGDHAVAAISYDADDMVTAFFRQFPELVGGGERVLDMGPGPKLNPRSSPTELYRTIAKNRLEVSSEAGAGSLPIKSPGEERALGDRYCLDPVLRAEFAAAFDGQTERLLSRYPVRDLGGAVERPPFPSGHYETSVGTRAGIATDPTRLV